MGINRNSIIILGLAGAFILGTLTANPVVEAAGGWKEAFDDLQLQITNIELLPGLPGTDGDDCTVDGTIVTCGATSSDVQGPAGNNGMDGASGAQVYGYIHQEECFLTSFPGCQLFGNTSPFNEFDPSGIISRGNAEVIISQSGLYHIELSLIISGTPFGSTMTIQPQMVVGSNPTNCDWTITTEDSAVTALQVSREMTCTFAAGDQFRFGITNSAYHASLLVTKIG